MQSVHAIQELIAGSAPLLAKLVGTGHIEHESEEFSELHPTICANSFWVYAYELVFIVGVFRKEHDSKRSTTVARVLCVVLGIALVVMVIWIVALFLVDDDDYGNGGSDNGSGNSSGSFNNAYNGGIDSSIGAFGRRYGADVYGNTTTIVTGGYNGRGSNSDKDGGGGVFIDTSVQNTTPSGLKRLSSIHWVQTKED